LKSDEAGTFDRLRSSRKELFEPAIDKHRGRIFKLMGDGLLAEFGSVVDAVKCAVTLQRGMVERNASVSKNKRIEVRIGINLEEVIVEGDDRYGEGVNVAARLQQLAEPGAICVSGKVSKEVEKKLAFGFEPMGEHRMKNISEPIACFRVDLQLRSPRKADLPTSPSLPDKPSIAVLPFQNMSGDPEQDYFADGMVEEIITALSRMRWLFVIARNSSFTYKGRTVDVRQVGRELGVRYLLEGSVRKAGDRVRITGQLIDASTGAHLWADRFDGKLEDIFALQDQVTASVVGAIAPKLEQAEIERTRLKPTESLHAYDYYLRGMAAMHLWTRQGNSDALRHFRRAIELDPGFASAYGMAARCYSQRKAAGWLADRARDTAEAERLARRAVELGKDDALALATAGITLAFVVSDLDDGAAYIDQALALNPNLAWGWLFSAFVKTLRGEPEAALECVTRAMRLSPQDVQLFHMQAAAAQAHFVAGRYLEALAWAEEAVRGRPDYLFAHGLVVASAALAMRLDEATNVVARLRQLHPHLRISDLIEVFPLRRTEDLTTWANSLRIAGLPD
jgi:TolB-like protein